MNADGLWAVPGSSDVKIASPTPGQLPTKQRPLRGQPAALAEAVDDDGWVLEGWRDEPPVPESAPIQSAKLVKHQQPLDAATLPFGGVKHSSSSGNLGRQYEARTSSQGSSGQAPAGSGRGLMRRRALAATRRQRLAKLDVGAESEGEYSEHMRPTSAVSATLYSSCGSPAPGALGSPAAGAAAQLLASGSSRRRATSDALTHGALSFWEGPLPPAQAMYAADLSIAPQAVGGPARASSSSNTNADDFGAAVDAPLLTVTSLKQQQQQQGYNRHGQQQHDGQAGEGLQPSAELPAQGMLHVRRSMEQRRSMERASIERGGEQSGAFVGPVARSLSRCATSNTTDDQQQRRQGGPCQLNGNVVVPNAALSDEAAPSNSSSSRAIQEQWFPASSTATSTSGSTTSTRPGTAASQQAEASVGGQAAGTAGGRRLVGSMGPTEVVAAAARAQAQLVQGFLRRQPSAGAGSSRPLAAAQGLLSAQRTLSARRASCSSAGVSGTGTASCGDATAQQLQPFLSCAVRGPLDGRPVSGQSAAGRAGQRAKQGSLAGLLGERVPSATPPKVPTELHTASGPTVAGHLQRAGQAVSQQWLERRRTLDQLLGDLHSQRTTSAAGSPSAGPGADGSDLPAKAGRMGPCGVGGGGGARRGVKQQAPGADVGLQQPPAGSAGSPLNGFVVGKQLSPYR